MERLRKRISIQGPKLEPEIDERLDEFFKMAMPGKELIGNGSSRAVYELPGTFG